MLKVLSVFGTRPEAIKMARVIHAMVERSDEFSSRICVTAQHRNMLDQTIKLFGITPHYDLDIMAHDQSPTQVAARVLLRLEPILNTERPDWVLLQGDTTTTAAAALTAFNSGVRVAHIEAGLRTNHKRQPFPEEINRRITSLVADLHFAPTQQARQNLLKEGLSDSQIVVTGNTVIDALHWALSRPAPKEVIALLESLGLRSLGQHAKATGGLRPKSEASSEPKVILITAHRRENFGLPLANICAAVRTIALRYGEGIHIVCPVHPNPNVSGTVQRWLGNVRNITLLPALDYLSMMHIVNHAYLIVTDSGGLQEEAPSLHKPVLVLRRVTERSEGVEAGTACVVGVETEAIVTGIARLLDSEAAYRAMTSSQNPYGDGRASERIIGALLNAEQKMGRKSGDPVPDAFT